MTIAYGSDKYTCDGCGKTAEPKVGDKPEGWGKGDLVPIDAMSLNSRVHFCDDCYPRAILLFDQMKRTLAAQQEYLKPANTA